MRPKTGFLDNLCGHRLAMLVAQVTVGFHRKGSAVFVAKPPAKGRNINPAFNAAGCKQMPEIVMSESLHARFRASSINRFPAFCNRQHVVSPVASEIARVGFQIV